MGGRVPPVHPRGHIYIADRCTTKLIVIKDFWFKQKYKEIEQLYSKYQADKVLLSDKAQEQREDEIIQKEKEARDFQKAKFGPEGELFKKRQELVKPIQDKVYSAIEAYAKKRGYDFIYDRSSNASMLYANPELDKTQDLIDSLKK